MSRAGLVLAASLTKIHPGAGRSPGTVDLPVVRDPLGIWYIPGSEFKGALKTFLARRKKCIGDGKVDCKSCGKLCCLLGGETAEPGASSLALLDLYPVLVPLPSSRKGIVYVTGRPLLARLKAAAEASGEQDLAKTLEDILKMKSIQNLKSGEAVLLAQGGQKVGYDFVAGRRIKLKCKHIKADILWDALKSVSPLLRHVPPKGRVLVADESLLTVLLDSALIRQTRVRLNRSTKTVLEGGLWTEEYIP